MFIVSIPQSILNTYILLYSDIIQEGIFRRTGSVARQNDLRRRINENTTLKFDDGVFSVHDCASVLKGILSDLPEPLLTDTYYAVHCQIAELCNGTDGGTTKEQRLLHSIQLLLLLLPLDNRSLLQDIINMLHETTKYEANNKMSAESLATLFSPHLICPRKVCFFYGFLGSYSIIMNARLTHLFLTYGCVRVCLCAHVGLYVMCVSCAEHLAFNLFVFISSLA